MGKFYNLAFAQTPTGANDDFLYVENQSENTTIRIHELVLQDAAAENIEVNIHTTAVTSSSPTAIVPVNLDLNNAENLVAKAEQGANLVVNGTLISTVRIDTVNKTVIKLFEQSLLLGNKQAFSLRAVTGTTLITGNLIVEVIDN